MTIIILISIKKCIIICWLFTTLNPSTSCIATRSKLYLINSLATVFSETCPVEAPNISCFKSHIRFPLARSFQSIRRSLRPCITLRSSSRSTPCGYPQLLIQYICIYLPYLMAASSIHIPIKRRAL